MKRLLCMGVILAFSAAALAAHSVDGVIGTGEWTNVITDPDDNSQLEMVSWGTEVEGDYLYWYCELSESDGYEWTDFQGYAGTKAKKIFPGLWIDADASTSTYLADGDDANCADGGKAEWATNHRGIDIDLELGLQGNWVNGVSINDDPAGEGPGDSQYNYWGDADDVGTDPVTAVSDGAWYVSGYVLEARVLLSELATKVSSLPDGAVVGDYLMVAVGVQGTNRDDITWGYDVGTPTAVAADPDTKALLPGDFNLDGAVDVSDLGILATNYGAEGAQSWKMGDANRDANVDVSDLGVLATNYGSTASGDPVNPVPEPATMTLLGVGIFSLLRRKK